MQTVGIHPYHFAWTLAPGENFTAPEAAFIAAPALCCTP